MNAREFESGSPPSAPASDHSRGYQWKSLFLPHGTELRLSTSMNTYYARVDGDRIMYLGRSVSPRGFTLATAGEGRNAWRDLWLKFPDDRTWKSAHRCRIEARAAPAPCLLSPHETMKLAAAAMAQALEAALALVKGSGIEYPPPDRRAGTYRRENDVLGETCAFD